jgi:renalase
MKTRDEEIIIVGAGLTGLTLARGLKQLGKSCLLLEKSRGLGGRIATRRIDNGGLDHGAFFLSYSQYFEDFLNLSTDIVLRSSQGFYLEGGMNRLAKVMATDLEILKNQKAHVIVPDGSRWKIQTEEGLTFTTNKLVLTAPLPQAISLLDANRLEVPSQLRVIEYKKALILLATFKQLPEELKSFSYQDHMIYFMRERQLHPQGVVIHLSDEVTNAAFDKSDNEILKLVQTLISSSPLKNLELEKTELKKWRYAEPLIMHPDPFAEVLPGLFLSGDAFSGALHSTNNLVQVLGSKA